MISVVITAYNAERFIEASIQSILAQSYTDLECVVVDDGSADGTYKIAMGMAEKDRRMLAIKAGRVGRGRALNIGWRAAKGDLIAIQDADDISHPDRIEIQSCIMNDMKDKSSKIGSPLAILGSTQLKFRENDNIPWPTKRDMDGREASRNLSLRNPLPHTSIIIRRNVLECVGGYDENRHDLFDWDLFIRVSMRELGIWLMDFPLVAHRIHTDQFFEGRKRLRYAWHCAQMQWRAIMAIGRSPFLALTIPPLFVYRLLPRALR